MVDNIKEPYDSVRYSAVTEDPIPGSEPHKEFHIFNNDSRILITTPVTDEKFEVVDEFRNVDLQVFECTGRLEDGGYEITEPIELNPKIEMMFWHAVYNFDKTFGPDMVNPDERIMMFEFDDAAIQIIYTPTHEPLVDEDPGKPKPVSEWEEGDFDEESYEKVRSAVKSFKRTVQAHKVSNHL